MISIATTTCIYGTDLKWNGAALVRLNSTDPKYTTFQFSSSTCITITSSDASSSPSVVAGFTYGDIVNSVFLFLIFAVVLYNFFWNSIKKH